MINTVNFIEHHDGHTHDRPTKVATSADYLLDAGVTFHVRTEPNGNFYLWTERGNDLLAGVEADPAEVAFDLAWETLRNASLDVLAAD